MNFNTKNKRLFVRPTGNQAGHQANHQSNDSVRDVDMVPMINVVFLLLTFFMIAGVFRSVNPVAVTLPETAVATSTVDRVPREITVDAEGLVSINGSAYPVDELGDVMTLLNESSDWVIRADAQASANSVIRVLSAVKAAGFVEVGLQAVSRL